MLLPEGGPLPGPKSGLLSNTWEWIVRGDTHADKAKDFIGKGPPGGRAAGKGNPGELLCHVAHISGFMGMGLASRVVSGQSSCLCPYLVQFLVTHASLSQGGFQRHSFWDVGRTYYGWHLLPPLDPSRFLPAGGSWSVPCFLLRPPVVR